MYPGTLTPAQARIRARQRAAISPERGAQFVKSLADRCVTIPVADYDSFMRLEQAKSLVVAADQELRRIAAADWPPELFRVDQLAPVSRDRRAPRRPRSSRSRAARRAAGERSGNDPGDPDPGDPDPSPVDQRRLASDTLAEALYAGRSAILPMPAGLGSAARIALFDAITDSVADVRDTGRDIRVRTISGIRLGIPDAELVFVVWEGDDEPQIGGAK